MSINLLPWRETRRKESRKKRQYRIAIYVAILFFLSLVIKLFLYVEIRKTHSKITLLNHQISNITLSDPSYENKSLLKKLIFFRAQQKLNMQMNDSIQTVLFHIANVIPNSIILNQLMVDSKKILLMGKSNQLADIHRYVNALQTEKIRNTAQLTDIQTNGKNHSIIRFTILLS